MTQNHKFSFLKGNPRLVRLVKLERKKIILFRENRRVGVRAVITKTKVQNI